MLAEFLIVAHIKKRSICDPTEKRDINGNMMLCCKFGCDYMFEQGYLYVDSEGKIKLSHRISDPVALSHAEQFSNRKIQVSNEQAPYFAWHKKNRAGI